MNTFLEVPIDRSTPFDSTSFLGSCWRIEKEDERCLLLTKIDMSALSLTTFLREGEMFISGKEKVKRIISSNVIPLDAKSLQTFLENQHYIPDAWKERTNGVVTFIFFDGTVLRKEYRPERYILCLFWFENKWCWFTHLLYASWGIGHFSVVLKA